MRFQLAQTLLVSALLSSADAAPWASSSSSTSSAQTFNNGQYVPDDSGKYQPGKAFKGSDGNYIPDDSGKYKPSSSQPSQNSGDGSQQQPGQDDSSFNRGGQSYDILKTTQYQGQTLDWVSRAAQGHVASAPPDRYPSRAGKRAFSSSSSASFGSLWNPHEDMGPDGSVPFLRNPSAFGKKQSPTRQTPSSSSSPSSPSLGKPESPQSSSAPTDYSGQHYHAGSAHFMDNHGTSGIFSVYDPYVQSKSDFSLLQINVGWNTHEHTVEAGIIHYENIINRNPGAKGDAAAPGVAEKAAADAAVPGPALFTYYTVNGYGDEGDNLGGYNTENAGWVQYDKEIYPGMRWNSQSTRGGNQVELEISYWLYQGNWWLWVADRWIGYYPGSIFPKNAKGEGISVKADHVWYYGEVMQSESDAKTTTDMGSGEWANAGYGKAAYVRNIKMFDVQDYAVDYDAKTIVVAEADMYTLETHWTSGKQDWNSYCFIGGPGANGKAGA